MADNLVNIMQTVINGSNLKIEVKEIIGAQVFVCGSTLHVTIGKTVTDTFGNEYTVTDMLINEWLELTPIAPAPAFADSVVCAAPINFLHGTPQTVNNEYQILSNVTEDKTPFVWLLENYQYTQPQADSSLAGIYEVVLFALDWCYEEEWTNTQHNELVIKPMENLANELVNSIKNDFQFRRIENVTIRPRARFGVEVTNRGNRQKIIDEALSGVEIRFSLEVFDVSLCC